MTKVVVVRGAGDGAGEVGACEGLEGEASRIAFVAKLCLKIGRETAHEGTDERSGNEYTHLSNIPALGEVQLEEVVFDLRPVGQSLVARDRPRGGRPARSEEHTSELQSLMRISYAVFCLQKKRTK